MLRPIILNYKVLYVSKEFIIGSRGYRLFISKDSGASWKYWARLPYDLFFIIACSRVLSRLFRTEITHLYKVKSGSYFCIAKKGIYRMLGNNNGMFYKIHDIKRGSRPLNIALDDDNNLFWGEYFSNSSRKEVHIFASFDNGNTWKPIFTFPAKSIRHIHGIFYDKVTDRLWCCTGDKDDECRIGYLNKTKSEFVVVLSGNQKYRTTNLFFSDNNICFATDSPGSKNCFYRIDRETSEISVLVERIQNSVIHSTHTSKFFAFSTTAEPSELNDSKNVFLWFSFDGINWKTICSYKKDFLPMKYFQFGTFTFPTYEEHSEFLYVNCRALSKLDRKSLKFEINQLLL